MVASTTSRRGLAVLATVLVALGFGLVHANAASAQTLVKAVTLTPPSDANPAGTPHTVTARVTGCIQVFPPAVIPCRNEVVRFTVTGGGNPSPSSGVDTTDSSGEATFTFTNLVPGTTNTITATVDGCGTCHATATKTWLPAVPHSMTLTPGFATNTVGSPHTVTATVKNRFGNPAVGVLVGFTVSGGGTPAPPSGADVTDLNGQATFTFTNTTAVTNTIRAATATGEGGCCVAFATKRWVAGPPFTLTLSPSPATNPVGTRHCVVARVTDASGNPTSGITVRFSVTGSVTTSGTAVTNPNGEAVFCYTGPPLPGADIIRAFADTNNNTVQDPGEPGGVAEKTWILPISTPGCEVKITNGGWIIAANGDNSTFGGNAKVDADGTVSGNEEYQDHGPEDPMNVHGNVLVVVCTSATEATVYGKATVDGEGDYFYRIKVRDIAEPGKDADTYEILVGNGYYSGDKVLKGGNVQVHQN